MNYFKSFPTTYYEFPDGTIKTINNLSLRPAIKENILRDITFFEEYSVEDGETPEDVSYKFYNRADLHWLVLLANDRMNIYTDWPKSNKQLDAYVIEKYRTQVDSDGNTVTMSDLETKEFIDFAGTAANNYEGRVLVSSTNSNVVSKPKFLRDANKIEHPIESATGQLKDAFGNNINLGTVTPVSIYAYEIELNDNLRNIVIPKAETIDQIERELRNIL